MERSSFTTIGLTAKLHLEHKDRVLQPILTVLRRLGVSLRVDPLTVGSVQCTAGCPPIDDVAALDALIIVGGDGTILRAMRELRPVGVPVIGINAGSVGFLSEMTLADIDVRLPQLLMGEGYVEQRSSMTVRVYRRGACIVESTALNDVVISQGSLSRLMNLTASVGGEFLATYHADGLIVSTPTGSTAYSLSAGGPVMHPTVSAMIITPINPHSFTQKPIVIPDSSPIDILLGQEDPHPFTNVTIGLTVDGQVYHLLEPQDRIHIVRGDTMEFLRLTTDAFYRALRTKLKWAEGLEQ